MKNKGCELKRSALLSALLLSLGVEADTINVDGTTCTLSNAILAANSDSVAGGCTAGSGPDVLELNNTGSLFTLTASLPVITSNITVNGNGSVVERDNNSPAFPVFYINAGGVAKLNDLTITGGASSDTGQNYGGGVVVRAGSSVEINNCVISGNTGGAVWLLNSQPSSINNSVIENNFSNQSIYYTGGVSINGGTLTIANSTISGNDNLASSAGGGGLYVTDFGGAVSVNVTNSTISGNSSNISGGGIGVIGFGNNGINLTLTNTTITNNTTLESGGGISSTNSNVTVSQSLISGNTATISAKTWSHTGTGTISVDDFNVFGEESVSGLDGVTLGSLDIVPDEPALGILDPVLADNGGPTPTHALAPGSRALDVTQEINCAILTDQTGKARPIDGNADGFADCDAGAYENPNPDIIFEDGFE